MQQEDFNLWNRLCSDGHAVFMEPFCELFEVHLSRRKEGAHQRLYEANRSDRKQCVKSGGKPSAGGRSESPTSSVVYAPPAGVSSSFSSFRQTECYTIPFRLVIFTRTKKGHKEMNLLLSSRRRLNEERRILH